MVQRKLIISANTYKVKIGDDIPYAGTLKIDQTAKPKRMDITETKGDEKGKTNLAIYLVADDILIVCYSDSKPVRPSRFTTEGALWLGIYKRQKGR